MARRKQEFHKINIKVGMNIKALSMEDAIEKAKKSIVELPGLCEFSPINDNPSLGEEIDS